MTCHPGNIHLSNWLVLKNFKVYEVFSQGDLMQVRILRFIDTTSCVETDGEEGAIALPLSEMEAQQRHAAVLDCWGLEAQNDSERKRILAQF
jgi:hypothetical protein